MDSHAEEFGDILTAIDDDLPVGELFNAATNAVVIANEATGRIIEINSAALRLLGASRTELVGRTWHQAVSERSATGGLPFATTLSSFRVARVAYVIIRLVPEESEEAPSRSTSDDVFSRLDAINTCFVVTNGALCVEFANKAFLQFVNQSGDEQVAGQSLLNWFVLTQADLSRMRQQMLSREACGVLTTKLRGGPESGSIVEITAIAVPDDAAPYWGFVMHRVVGH